MKLSYPVDDYSQGYDQIKEAFRCPTKDDILQPYTFDQDFRQSNIVNGGIENGYILFVSDIYRYHKTSRLLK